MASNRFGNTQVQAPHRPLDELLLVGDVEMHPDLS